MDQKISIKIAERTFNLTAPTPEKEEIIRLAADAVNQHLQAYTRRYPGKTLAELMPMVALNECVSRITVQRERPPRMRKRSSSARTWRTIWPGPENDIAAAHPPLKTT